MNLIRNHTPKLDFIDGLRGIAIVLVIIVHVGDVLLNLSRGILAFSDYGQFGVQLFFVVSAFTLCLTMDHRSEEQPWTKFYLRRYFRIAPLYYFGIVLYFVFFSLRSVLYGNEPVFPSWYTFRNVFANLLLMNDFTPGSANNNIVPGGWSIATEATFYLIFPLLLFLYKRIEKNKVLLFVAPFIGLIIGGASIYSLGYILNAIGKRDFWEFIQKGDFLYYNLLCQLPVFLMGMSLYFLLQKYKKLHLNTIKGSVIGFIVFAVAAAYLLAHYEEYIYLLPFTAGVSFIFLFILFRERPSLSSPLLCRIGQLSYSIYLFHFIFAWEGTRFLYQVLQPYLSSDVILVISSFVSLVLSIGLAILSEKYIERPGIALGKRIIKRLKSKATRTETYEKATLQIIEMGVTIKH